MFNQITRIIYAREWCTSYDPHAVSSRVINSLLYTPAGIKPNRLTGKGYALCEATTGKTTSGRTSTGRICIGYVKGQFLCVDGRHLLEAYRIIGKRIPRHVISYDTITTKKLFTSQLT